MCLFILRLTLLIAACMLSTARAYFISSSHDPENLTRAEAALEELITSIDSAASHVRVADRVRSCQGLTAPSSVYLGEHRISTASMDEASCVKASESR